MKLALNETVSVHLATLPKACMPGTVTEIKPHTGKGGIVLVEIDLGNTKLIEDFWLDTGISIKGEVYGHIAQHSCEEEYRAVILFQEARSAFRKDEREAFQVAEFKLLKEIGITNFAATRAVFATKVIRDFCKGTAEDPPPETLQAFFAFASERR